MINESLSQIENRLRETLLATPPFSTTNMSPSQVGLWSNFLFIIASEIHTLEQLNNAFETEIQAIIDGVTTPTNLWWQAQILKFQYSATTPQVAQLNTVSFSPYYPLGVDATLRIVSNCSVITSFNSQVQIKVTNDGAILTAPQLLALTAYIQTIDPAGINWAIINSLPDYLFLNADVYYNGQYAAIIQANVIAALETFLASIPFNGIVKVSSLEDAIQAVPGVTDVVISEAAAMQYATYISSGYGARTIFTKQYQSYSGQILNGVAPNDFANTLNFIVGNQ